MIITKTPFRISFFGGGTDMEEYFKDGQIVNTHGIKGEVKVIPLTDDVNTMKEDIIQLKENEEITTTQQEMIIELARKRVIIIIGDDPLEIKKYFKIFIQRLYKDTRQNAGLGSKIARTKKCDYQRCVDYIEAWLPRCGCAELRAKADANAKARLEARKLGYVS